MRKLVSFGSQVMRQGWIFAALFCLLTPSVFATSFMHVANGVWSTGFAVGGTNLPQNVANTIDPHFTLIQLPTGCSGITCTQDGTTPFNTNTFVVQGPAPLFPFDGAWNANTSSSAWIGPRSNQSGPDSLGSVFPWVGVFANDSSPYVYRMTFNLGALGLDPLTAIINLAWQSDNNPGSGIRLCSIASASDPVCAVGTTIASSGNGGHSGALTPLTLQNGVNATFTSGLMALDFIVFNSVVPSGYNPSGLRVQINSADANSTSDVPEPGTALLIGAALIAFGVRHRS